MQALNPSTREDYKTGGDRYQSQSEPEDLWRQDHTFWPEVAIRASGWPLCFSGLQVDPQFLSLRFY